MTNVAFTTANVTNPRYDTVVAWEDTSVTTLSFVNSPGSFKFKVITGTAAGSPIAISDAVIQSNLGAGIAWTRLADVLRPAGVDNVTNANITDLRAPIKLRVSANAKAIELAAMNGGNTAGALVSDASGNVGVVPYVGEVLGSTVLAASAATMTVNLPKTAETIRITVTITGQTGNTTLAMRFNSDGTNSYAFRATNNSSVEGVTTTAFSIQLTEASVNPHNTLSVIDVLNLASRTKTAQIRTIQGSANASATPTRRLADAVWANTSAQISSVTIYDSTSTSQFNIGSKVVVTAA